MPRGLSLGRLRAGGMVARAAKSLQEKTVAGKRDLHVEKVDAEGAVVYRFSGALGEGQKSYDFLNAMRSGIQNEPDRIVFNLSSISYLSSPGVGIIAACYTSAKNANKALVLACLDRQNRKTLQVCGVIPAVEAFDSEEDAVQGGEG